MSNIEKRLKTIDQHLVALTKDIKLISSLSWHSSVANSFLESWRSGSPKLPKIVYEHPNYSSLKRDIRDLIKVCDVKHPMGAFLYETGRSFILALSMLENLGRKRFTEVSIEVYGRPRDQLGHKSRSVLEVANHFISATNKFIDSCSLKVEEYCMLPDFVSKRIQKEVNRFFKAHQVEIVTDPEMASKAAAGASRIRIRDFTCFSKIDIKQLLHHEAFVHTLTLINGREQPNLSMLGIGAPRTTKTQEGLAIFSELITNSMDLSRLRRISSRVQAIDMALAGADFIDLFKYFLELGQNEFESFQSAMRIFRGGNVKGKVVFTKDVVYLQGFVEVHSFLLRAMQNNKVNYPHYLFSGRLSLDDVLLLEPLFESGFIKAPYYEPEWIENRPCLMAFLLYSAFVKQLNI